jgi:hypothetical protein
MIVAGERAQACLDYFFTEPRFRMRIDASEDAMAVAAFATTSFVTAELVGRVRRLGEAAALKDRLQIIIDTIPAVVWSSSRDGSTNFLNIRTVGPVRRSAAFTTSSFYLCNPHGQKSPSLFKSWCKHHDVPMPV